MELCNPAVVKELLNKYSLAPQKAFGQNFLINPAIPQRIAEASSSLSKNTPRGVLEIGPGMGALTQYLCEEFDKVVAVEIDRGFIPLLNDVLSEYSNFYVVEADFLKLDLEAFIREHFSDILAEGGSVSVCANLPYYITTPVIMKLLESFPESSSVPFDSIVVMVQLEVARRLAADEKSADYGAISASISLRAKTERLFDVSPNNFIPAPKVASAVVSIVPHGGIAEVYPLLPTCEKERAEFTLSVGETISLAFGQRRKTLVNALSGRYPKDKTIAALAQCGIREDIRGEKLSAYDFCRVTDILHKLD